MAQHRAKATQRIAPKHDYPRKRADRHQTTYDLAGLPRNALVVHTKVSEAGVSVTYMDRSGIHATCTSDGWSPSMIRGRVLAFVRLIEGYSKLNQENRHRRMGKYRQIFSQLLLPDHDEMVMRLVEKARHLIFVASSHLAMLPFAALKYQGGYLIQKKQVSHVPSLNFLRDISIRKAKGRLEGLSTVEKTEACVISRPGSLLDEMRSGFEPLPMAGIEAFLIARAIGHRAIDAANTTISDFQQHFRSSKIVHVSTHGFNDPDDPLKSSILFKEKLRVLDLAGIKSCAVLVVFSACHSGRGDCAGSPNMQGFPWRVLASGANAFLGGLWSVNDVMTTVHMYFFYTCLFTAPDVPSIGEAWQRATIQMMQLDADGLASLLKSFLASWSTSKAADASDGKPGTHRRGRRALEATIESLQREDGKRFFDLADPFFWSGFNLAGNASEHLQSVTTNN